jgi:hypothetical protein
VLASTALLALQRCRACAIAARLLCWFRLRFSRCSAALCAATVYYRRLMFSVAVRAPSLDAPPGFCAGVNRASRVAVLHARQVMVRPVVRGGRGAPSNPHFGAILDFFGPREKAHVSTHSTLAVVSKTPFVL